MAVFISPPRRISGGKYHRGKAQIVALEQNPEQRFQGVSQSFLTLSDDLLTFYVIITRLTTEAEAKVRLREFTTFFITRHPFERLVSCYTDKFTNHSDLRVYRDKYGVQIAAEQATDHLHGLEYVNPGPLLRRNPWTPTQLFCCNYVFTN